MNCVIVEDDKTARAILANYIANTPELTLKGEFETPIKALNFIKSNAVDLIYLDYEMPEMNGLQIAKVLKDTSVKIIFTTAHADPALEAYRYNIFAYLLKPITYEMFIEATQKVINFTESQNKVLQDFMFVRHNKTFVKILISDIKLIEAQGDYISIYLDKKKFLILSTLKHSMEFLPEDKFIQVHRSFIVALESISKIHDDYVEIAGKSVPLTPRYKKILLKKLSIL